VGPVAAGKECWQREYLAGPLVAEVTRRVVVHEREAGVAEGRRQRLGEVRLAHLAHLWVGGGTKKRFSHPVIPKN